ncbi:MAG: hypothetical protein ACKVWR_05495, partial [Acidimicrobiales bacterium]
AATVTAVDINGDLLDLVRREPFKTFTADVYRRPNVQAVHAEGRSFLRREGGIYDLIQLSGTDTYAALSSGSYILSESYLYTEEAFDDYFAHLSENGVLCIIRFGFVPPRESLKLVATAAHALRSAGVAELVLANRSLERAEELAARFGAVPAPLTHLVSELVHADVVLTSTGSDSVVIEQADVLAAVAARDGRPLLIVDLAVPRDVDPGAAEAPGVALVDLDDLRRFAERGLAARERELGAVQRIVAEELARYTAADNAREAAPVVAALRSRAEELRLAELAKLARRADGLGLDAAQLQAVDALTRGLLAKLLHQPSVELKAAAGTERGARLAQSAAELFGL